MLSVLAAGIALSGCGPMAGVMLAGNVVNAAGYAAVDASDQALDPEGVTERRRGIAEHLAWIGAENGDPGAAYQLATLLTKRRDPSAMRWMCEAAREGHAGAQMQLGHWYNEDRRQEDLWPFIDVTPDNRVAYAWYTSALDNGEDRAFIFRETLSRAGGGRALAQGASQTLPGCSGGRWWHATPRDTAARDA